MTDYLDIVGLGYFKDKLDDINDAKFVRSQYLDDIIDNKLLTVYTYRGTVSSVEDLPYNEYNKVGDVYDVNGGMNYAWDGTKWDALGENKIEVDAALNSESANPVQNKVIKEALDKKAGLTPASQSNAGLMSAEDKKKLDGIDENASKYEPPESPAGAKTLDLYKIATNANGMVIEANKVIKTDITALGIPATDTKYNAFNRSTDGLVPHPTTSTSTRYLREDGSWEVPPDNDTTYTAITNAEIDELFK